MNPDFFLLDDIGFPSAEETPHFALDDFQWPPEYIRTLVGKVVIAHVYIPETALVAIHTPSTICAAAFTPGSPHAAIHVPSAPVADVYVPGAAEVEVFA